MNRLPGVFLRVYVARSACRCQKTDGSIMSRHFGCLLPLRLASYREKELAAVKIDMAHVDVIATEFEVRRV